jgi:hypothetical protein
MGNDNESWRVHDDEGYDSHEHEPPRGTLLIMIGYLIVIVALWMETYLMLLSNGGLPPL